MPLSACLSALVLAGLPADLVVVNARIYTVDEGRPAARALAVQDGRIVALAGC